MSIQLEVQRLENAKSDIASAIGEKGVTVPSTAKIDTFGDYVRQISGPSPTPSGGLMEVSAEEFTQRIQQRIGEVGEGLSYRPVGIYGISIAGVLFTLVPCTFDLDFPMVGPYRYKLEDLFPEEIVVALDMNNMEYTLTADRETIQIDAVEGGSDTIQISIEANGIAFVGMQDGIFAGADIDITYYVF